MQKQAVKHFIYLIFITYKYVHNFVRVRICVQIVYIIIIIIIIIVTKRLCSKRADYTLWSISTHTQAFTYFIYEYVICIYVCNYSSIIVIVMCIHAYSDSQACVRLYNYFIHVGLKITKALHSTRSIYIFGYIITQLKIHSYKSVS